MRQEQNCKVREVLNNITLLSIYNLKEVKNVKLGRENTKLKIEVIC